MADRYVTITGFKHYYDLTPFRIGGLIRCSKDVDNPHDGEAIRCSLPHLGTVGYLANSPSTVAGGTYSAVFQSVSMSGCALPPSPKSSAVWRPTCL